MQEDFPEELVLHISNLLDRRDLPDFNLVSRRFHAVSTLALSKLKDCYEKLKGKKPEQIVDACCNSLDSLHAVFMSDLVCELKEQHIIQIATCSFTHARIVIHYQVDTQRKVYPKAKTSKVDDCEKLSSESSSSKSSDPMAHMIIAFLDMDFKISVKDLFPTNTKAILLGIANHNPHYALLVIQHGIQKLNGYTIMELAKLSPEHTRKILQNPDAKAKLKEGHLLGIAKTSFNHAELVLKYCFNDIRNEKIREIISAIPDTLKILFTIAKNTLGSLPLLLARKKPEACVSISLLLLNGLFYSPKNSFWNQFQRQKIDDSVKISKALQFANMSGEFKDQVHKAIVISIAGLSLEHAKSMLAEPRITKHLTPQHFEILASISPEYKDLASSFMTPGVSFSHK